MTAVVHHATDEELEAVTSLTKLVWAIAKHNTQVTGPNGVTPAKWAMLGDLFEIGAAMCRDLGPVPSEEQP